MASSRPEFYLSKLYSEDDLKEVVVERWGYNPLPPLPLTTALREETSAKISKALPLAEYSGFQVLYFQLNEAAKTARQTETQFLRSTEREAICQIPQSGSKLFVFSLGNDWWQFVSAEQVGNKLKLKRFSIEPDNRNKLRTASEQLDKVRINPAVDTTLQKVRDKHEEAFRVELLTERFYEEYVRVFKTLRQALYNQKGDIDDALKVAHHYTHLLLNRILFLYFVQKRGCFGNDKDFLHTFWNTYRDSYEGGDEFQKKWLNILFFEALNNNFHPKDYFKFPDSHPNFNNILQLAPFLNGGLFTKHDLDSINYQVSDEHFAAIFDFIESYNFTIQESTPLDQDLSIDPEMLGNIYEILVNVSDTETDDERHTSGIFYTPKVEIELMVRRSLVEFLANKTSVEKSAIYRFVFRDLEIAEAPKLSQEERDSLLRAIDDIRLVDPACGSGHYLVVSTQILYELKEELYKQKGIVPDRFEEKSKIIEKSIYGVDVKGWATEVAKLRLWLDLFVDASEEQFQIRNTALLPKLSFKIRVGDSLVQEIGGVYFSPSAIHGLPASLVSLLNQLKDLKKRFYNNDRFIEENQVRGLEIQFYKSLLEEKIREIQRKISQLESCSREVFQQQLLAIQQGKEEYKQIELPSQDKEKKAGLEKEIELLRKQQEQLRPDRKFALWPIEFAEIFAEKGGFDLVIANPPYVRQEIIADPTKEENTLDERRKYKDKLQEQIQKDWNDPEGKWLSIPKRSDLYVYFYLKGLALLNPEGIFCYISSNSWLDVDYGAALQEILLKRVPILAVYDNQAKRSFKHADVNTIIAILGAPKVKDWVSLKENTVRFVMFKKPFEEILTAKLFIEIEQAERRQENDLFKIFPISQIDLWKAGAEPPESGMELDPILWEYEGNKWGGKYLRAPEIYWTILEKAGDKLVRLGDIAEVHRGFTTGANEFFYVEDVTDELDD